MALARRWLGLAMTMILMVIAVTLCVPMQAQASDGNDTAQTATRLNLGQAYSGVISDSGDEDWYAFTLPSAGKVQLGFGKGYNSNERRWRVQVYSSDQAHEFVEMYPSTATSQTETRTLGLRAGTYYVKVSNNWSSYEGGTYSLKLSFTSSANWEEEANDSPQQAKRISLNKKYSGTASYDDEDWFKFTLSKKQRVYLNFYKAYNSDTRDWWATLYNSTQSKEFVTMNPRTDSSLTDFEILTLKAGTYYVKVEGSSSYSELSTYSINVSTKKVANGKKQKITASGKTVTYYCSWYGKKKKLDRKVTFDLYASAANGVAFSKKSGNSKIKVSKSGHVTLKKGLKKGTYKVKVKIAAPAGHSYNAATKTITLKVKLKK